MSARRIICHFVNLSEWRILSRGELSRVTGKSGWGSGVTGGMLSKFGSTLGEKYCCMSQETRVVVQ